MINHRNKQNYRFRTWKIRDRCHLKGGVRQGCFQSLILNYLIQYIHFHSLYITSHYHAKFKENPCVGTDARPPFNRNVCKQTVENLIRRRVLRRLIWFCTVCRCSTKDPMLIWDNVLFTFNFSDSTRTKTPNDINRSGRLTRQSTNTYIAANVSEHDVYNGVYS